MTLSDLPGDLVGEIFSRVPLESLSAVRSTCKTWNALSKNMILGKATRDQFRGFMVMDYMVCSISFNLKGIHNNDSDSVNATIKEISVLDQVEAHRVFHCDGLLLCVPTDDSKLVVWNPYLGQTRWIQTSYDFNRLDDKYALGYDSRRNHKILRFLDSYTVVNHKFPYQIYDFRSNSWTRLNVTPDWNIKFGQRSVSLKGNTYFLAHTWAKIDLDSYMLCFDFTAERFGQRLSLPFHSDRAKNVTLSCIREEQLAVLYQSCKRSGSMTIWITNKIDPNVVSWSKFLKVAITPFTGFPSYLTAESFFLDEEKKIALVLDRNTNIWYRASYYQTAHIFGEDGYLKSVNTGQAHGLRNCQPLVVSSYVPSLVQLQINQLRKRKQRY